MGHRAEARQRNQKSARHPGAAKAGRRQAGRKQSGSEPAGPNATASPDKADLRRQLREKFGALEAREPEKRMIYPHVDEQVVAAVVSDWTGIPVGRMVQG